MGGQRKREKEGEECKGWGTEREGGERERERCTYMYTTTIIKGSCIHLCGQYTG